MFQLTSKKTKTGGLVGLDIEAGSVAAAEVRSNGSAKVVGAAVAPLPAGAFHEGEVVDGDLLADAVKDFFGENKLSKRVRLGLGSTRVVVRSLRLPAIDDPKEMAAAVGFQAQEQIPMPLEEAVLEHQVVGGVAGEEGSAPQVEVIVVAVRRDTIAAILDPLRKAGLDPVGVDLSAFGMIRALAAADAEAATDQSDAVLYCNLGDAMNLAVARGTACLFTRVSAAGMEEIGGRLASRRGLSAEHAAQWLTHVGLQAPVEAIEGDAETVADARQTLEDGVSGLVDELRLSLDYYGAQEGAVRVGRIVLCGPGSAIPGLPEHMETGLGLPISARSPEALSSYDSATAARLTLSYGLALES